MTLKHMKYEDSTIMHSLEKLMLDKGMIKVDPLKKIASKQIKKELDLKPTKNLVENIMKLCSGLKVAGLEKYAEELENVFLAYKTAENIYETSKEKGEDLIDQAHPKGSHKLEGVLGDNVVETILDRQLEMLKIVNKKPTGKLSTASDVIKAVKMCFAEEGEINIEAQTKAKQAYIDGLNKVISGITKIKNSIPEQDISNVIGTINDTIEHAKDIIKKITAIDISNEFPISVINELGSYMYNVQNWIKQVNNDYILKLQKRPDYMQIVTGFNSGKSIINVGQSLIWAGNSARQGDLSGFEFSKSLVSSDSVANIINSNLIIPLNSIKVELDKIDYNDIKINLPLDKQNKAESVINQIQPAIESAIKAKNNALQSGGADRLLLPTNIGKLFEYPFSNSFNVKTLDQLLFNCKKIISNTNNNINIIKSWIDNVKK